MRDRIFAPAGMNGARIAADPRGLVDDYATGNGFDLRPRVMTLPYGPTGSHAPAGGALASLNDMAAWVRLQLRQGLAAAGRRVVSAANLAAVLGAARHDPDGPRARPRRRHGRLRHGLAPRGVPGRHRRWCGTTGRSTGSRPIWPSCRSTTSAWSCSAA